MKAFVTGATGFVGGRLAARLRERGDEVVALVRDPGKAGRLRELGCAIVEGDLSSRPALAAAMEGCDAVFHVAAIYRNGVPRSKRDELFAANVTGTENALDAAVDAGVGRIVYVSSNVAFGDTRGEVVDETYEPPAGQYVSLYHETKALAHRAARDRIAQGAPIVIVQPGGIYGRRRPHGDRRDAGSGACAARSSSFRSAASASTGCSSTTWWRGSCSRTTAGGSGSPTSSGARSGRCGTRSRSPSRPETTGRGSCRCRPGSCASRRPSARSSGSAFADLVSASDGVTYWGRDDKARSELGYAPRDLVTGLREAFG